MTIQLFHSPRYFADLCRRLFLEPGGARRAVVHSFPDPGFGWTHI